MKERRGCFGNALTLTLLIGAIYIGIFAAILDPMLIAFGASEATLPYAHDLMAYLLPGLLLTNVAFSLNNVMRASGYPVRAMVTMMIGAGINVVLDPIFIFGLDMGIKGSRHSHRHSHGMLGCVCAAPLL